MTGSKPSVLVVTPRCPLPLTSGTQIRSYHVLRALSERADVTLVTLVQSGEGTQRLGELSELVTVHTVSHERSKFSTLCRFPISRQPYRCTKFNTAAFRDRVHDVLAEQSFDLVWLNFLNTAGLLPDSVGCPVVLDEHNADVRYWESFLDGAAPERLFAHSNIRRIERFRDRIVDRIDGVVSVSDGDAEEARSWAGRPVWVMPNGVDTDTFSTGVGADRVGSTVLFVGSLDVRMNEEAVEWFAESAWPSIRSRYPDAVFEIVGRNPTQRVTALADRPGVKLVGEVPSVVEYYEEAAVVVAPLQFGGGTKLKVLEALAMSRPLVTTPAGTTGIPLTDGEHAVVADREAFSEAVVSLLDTPARRATLGQQGRSFVESRFTWPAVTADTTGDVFEWAGLS
jgi:glycosyltransferase involved in cell wall biosynthesis